MRHGPDAAVIVRARARWSRYARLAAQQSAPPQSTPPATFRAATKLIVTTVVVRNPDGTPVEGLTADDFIVTEDNEPQDIAFVEYQRLDNLDPLPPMGRCRSTNAPRPSGAGGVVDRHARDHRASVRRRAVPQPAADHPVLRSVESLQRRPGAHVHRRVGLPGRPDDRGGSRRDPDVSGRRGAGEAGFHRRPAKLANVLDVLANGEDADGDGVLDFQDFSSAFGQNDGEFNVFTTDRKLAALQTAVTMLRPLPEQKSLVFFTDSLSVNGTDNNAQMRATTNAAIRANVQIFPVDARGLVAMAPLGNANQRSPGGIGMFTGALAQQAGRAAAAVAGHVLRAGEGHRRQGARGLQRPVARDPPGGRGADQLLHPRLLQHPCGERRQVPPHAGAPQGRARDRRR